MNMAYRWAAMLTSRGIGRPAVFFKKKLDKNKTKKYNLK
jgi:hypothetical protein